MHSFLLFSCHTPKLDSELRNWLKDLHLDNPDITRKFSEQELTLHDVLTLMTRDDLSKLNLKLGPELRIWDKIIKDRKRDNS